VSLLKKLGKTLSKGVRAVGKLAVKATPAGRVLGALRGVTAAGGGIAAASMLPALPAIGGAVARSLPGIGRVGGAVAGAAGRVIRSPVGRAVGAAATGVAIYDAAGNMLGYQKKRRRINPMNWRALNRALRRVEKAKKAAKRINAVSIRKKDC
jgi:hypothetical protein